MEHENQRHQRRSTKNTELLYTITDVPPWYMCILLGFQHYLTMFGSTIAVPLILAGPLGIENDNVAKSQFISTIFFASGISTLLQTSLGNRLPIVQGAAFAFVAPAIAVFQSIEDAPVNSGNGTDRNAEDVANPSWRSRILEVQGAIIVASTVQIVLGLAGIIGLLMRRIGPLTIAPTIVMVGLGLFEAAGSFAGTHWGIALLTIVLIILFSQHLRSVKVPVFHYSRNHGWKRTNVRLFTLFPVILAVLLSWMFCIILTAAGAFPDDPKAYGYSARTDIRTGVLHKASWFRVPYPGQWGAPKFSASAIIGMISGTIASIIESVGDYYACAKMCDISAPPSHAVNRGIFMEGIGCIIAGALGTGNGTTSYSENIGAIGITKVASRRVVQTGACIMIFLAVIGKFGALFVTIPDPVVGGMFCVMFGMIVGVGLSSLQHVDLNSSRNLFVVGFSIFLGIAMPEWVNGKEEVLETGTPELDQVILVILKTGMFIAGLTAFILDNTIPGTDEERGIKKWRENIPDEIDQEQKVAFIAQEYEFPEICSQKLYSTEILRYIPICPHFRRNTGDLEMMRVQGDTGEQQE